MRQRDILFVSKKLEHGGKHGFEDIFHPLRTKTVKGTEIRALTSGQPHEREAFPNSFSDFPGRVQALCVGVDYDFG
ncbi:hypothetical protein D3C73_1381110 [compost metagenome]